MSTVKEVKESSALGTLRPHAKKAFPTASVKIASDQIPANEDIACLPLADVRSVTLSPSYAREFSVTKLSFIACRITTERDVVSCGV